MVSCGSKRSTTSCEQEKRSKASAPGTVTTRPAASTGMLSRMLLVDALIVVVPSVKESCQVGIARSLAYVGHDRLKAEFRNAADQTRLPDMYVFSHCPFCSCRSISALLLASKTYHQQVSYQALSFLLSVIQPIPQSIERRLIGECRPSCDAWHPCSWCLSRRQLQLPNIVRS